MPEHQVVFSRRVRWVFFWVNYAFGWWFLIMGIQMWDAEDWIIGHLTTSRILSAVITFLGIGKLLQCMAAHFHLTITDDV